MVGAAKNRAGRGPCVQKGMIVGRKGSICPKRDSSRARNGRCIKHGAGRGLHVQKVTIAGKKWSAHPKTGQEGVYMSKKGRFRARRDQHVQKWGRKGFVYPKRDDCRQ